MMNVDLQVLNSVLCEAQQKLKARPSSSLPIALVTKNGIDALITVGNTSFNVQVGQNDKTMVYVMYYPNNPESNIEHGLNLIEPELWNQICSTAIEKLNFCLL